eukprot:scaffold1891_cov362-Prasinococcus_capsulatus_cf.AAC.5
MARSPASHQGRMPRWNPANVRTSNMVPRESQCTVGNLSSQRGMKSGQSLGLATAYLRGKHPER